MTGIVKDAAREDCQRKWSSAAYQDNKLKEAKPEIGYWSSSSKQKPKNRDSPNKVKNWTYQFDPLIPYGKGERQM